MSDSDEKVEAGGGVAQKGLPPSAEHDDFDELRERFEKLSKQDRRRTIQRLSRMYEEDESGEHLDSRDKDIPLSHDQNFENVHVPLPQVAASNVSQITVEQSDKKLPRFSGSAKLTQGEVSYRRWQRAATRIVEENIPEAQKKKALLKSLQGRADDIADLHRGKTSNEILDVLEKHYGSTVDGDELLIEFYQILQSDKQTASEYLSLLFVELGEVVKFGGLDMGRMSKTLLKQFVRGTQDEEMLNKLRLEDKLDNPPSFPDLICSIRREESKRTERRLRHKKQARLQAASVKSEVPADEMLSLQQRLADLEAVSSRVDREPEPQDAPSTSIAPRSEPQPPVPAPPSELVQLQQRMAHMERQFSTVRNRNIFCYRCGEDAHMATDCQNPPNKKLVQEKADARRKRRQTNPLN